MKKLLNKLKNNKFIRTFKEEMIVIPLLLFAFFIFNYFAIRWFPNSAFFDYFSQIETIVLKIILFFIALFIAHLSLRMAFPKIHKFLDDYVYQKFDEIPQDKKIDYAIKFILVFILSAALVFSARGATQSDLTALRNCVVENISQQLNVREITPNRSPQIDIYLTEVGCELANPWCGAFVGANLTWLEIENPNSAYSPDYAQKKDIIWTPKRKINTEPLAGDVVTYYYTNLGRVGHVGFLTGIDKDGYFITIEGNTNGTGSREGDGVYKKKREPQKVYAVARYIK